MAQRKRKRGKRAKRTRHGAPPTFQRALELFELGQLVEAERLASQLVNNEPRNVDARQLAALIARRGKRYDAAIAHIDVAREIQPDSAALASTLGLLRKDKGELELAIAAFRRATELAPRSSQCAFNLGIALEEAGDGEGAMDAYRRACERDPQNALARYNLARACEETGDVTGAESAYRDALAIRPEYPKALNNLANLLRRRQGAARDEALELYRQATSLAPGFAGAWCNRGLLLIDLGRADEARGCFEQAQKLDADNATAAHMLAAASGTANDDAPHAYVEALFDDYANTFDQHLTGSLDYAVPRLLGNLLRSHCSEPKPRGLDLGCGTGLFAEHMRPLCQHLVGVDLSPKMVEAAHAKARYDELHVGDIESFLAHQQQRFDIVAAADVFTYCGDLSSIIAAVTGRLAADGLFLFSTEAMLADGELELRSTGRYAHAKDQLVAIARANRLDLLGTQRSPIRSNHGEPIIGDLYVFRGPAEPKDADTT